jgi:FkbM family methyltransferase
LEHPDRSQFLVQVAEIVEERTYLRHGIELEEGDLVLDVGGHVGVAAIFFALECGAGRVHSFEPVAPLYELFRGNTRGLDRISPHPYGIYGESGTMEITYYPGAPAMSGLFADRDAELEIARQSIQNLGEAAPGTIRREAEDMVRAELVRDTPGPDRFRAERMTCEVRTLSDALRDEGIEGEVALLKIDVEKAETEAISGIEEGDWTRIRQLAIETHDDAARDSIEETLRERGYEVRIAQEEVMSGTEVGMLYAGRAR